MSLDNPFILESPDKGRTVYCRRFGDHTHRELMKSEEENAMTMSDEKWKAIQDHCRKVSLEALQWDIEDHKRWGEPWSTDQTLQSAKTHD